MFIERDIEAAKIDIALKPDFNLVDCFKLFDIKSLGGISKQDFMDGLRLNLDFKEYTPNDVTLLCKRYDRGLGHVAFNGFGDIILPHTQEFAHMITGRPDYYIRKGTDLKKFFSYDTRAHLKNLFRVML